jgi:hypothetical protein
VLLRFQRGRKGGKEKELKWVAFVITQLAYFAYIGCRFSLCEITLFERIIITVTST